MRSPFLLMVILLTGAFFSQAQVQVSKEPRHHNVFENSKVRILDVRIPPGDTTLFHKHSTPSVFLVLTSTKTGSEVLVEPARIQLTEGNVWFEGFYDKPRIHRVWNSDTKEFHVIDMELPDKDHQAIDAPLDSAGIASAVNGPARGIHHFRLLFDEKPVRGYRLTLDAGAGFRLGGRKAAIVSIRLSDGHYDLIPAGEKDFGCVNTQKIPLDYAFFELK